MSQHEPQLRDLLENDPCSVHFFQAVQLLERIYPDREPVGFFVKPAAEIARFGAHALYREDKGFRIETAYPAVRREFMPPAGAE